MDRKAMYKLSYGLFILTAKEAEKDNGSIMPDIRWKKPSAERNTS